MAPSAIDDAAASPILLKRKRQSTRTEYVYRPLTEGRVIRVLELYPAGQREQLEVRLRIVRYNEAPAYEAISYHWGAPERTEEVVCENKALWITPNLKFALHKLRYQDKVRVLWVDALCIDQDNLKERGHQVQIMMHIYRHAASVLIWLGIDQARSAKKTFFGLREFARSWESVIRRIDVANEPYPHEEYVSENETIEDDFYTALSDLLHSPWFSRKWILQELGTGFRAFVIRGDEIISWDDLVYFTELFSRQREVAMNQMDIPIWRIEYLNLAFRNIKRNGKFVEVLHDARNQLASDPRDNIYALLGHPAAPKNDDGVALIEPDYSKPTEEVYREVALTLIQAYANLDVLSAVQHLDESNLGKSIPSWVASWDHASTSVLAFLPDINASNQKPKMCRPQAIRAIKASRFKLSAEASLDLEKLQDEPDLGPHVIGLQGFKLDTVHIPSRVLKTEYFLSDPPAIEGVTDNLIRTLWLDVCKGEEQSPAYSSLEQTMDAFASVLTVDTFSPPTVAVRAYIEATPEKIKKLRQQDSHPELDQPGYLLYGRNIIRQRAMSACNNRKIFCTSQGFFGIGPAAMQPEDCVSILFGGKTPFVLRPQGDRYLLIGECFIAGLMLGEAMKLAVAHEKHWEMFQLE